MSEQPDTTGGDRLMRGIVLFGAALAGGNAILPTASAVLGEQDAVWMGFVFMLVSAYGAYLAVSSPLTLQAIDAVLRRLGVETDA